MIYPKNFESKIGFTEIRRLLRGECLSTLGSGKVDEIGFSDDAAEVNEWLRQVQEFRAIQEADEDFPLSYFFDLRAPVARVRPENTHLEASELFDLRRSLETIHDIVKFLEKDEYPALRRLCDGIATFPELIAHIDRILDKFGHVRDNASPELARIRQTLAKTENGISHTLHSILRAAQSEGIVEKDVSPTMRDGRLMIPVVPGQKRKIKGIVHDESASGRTVFIEPAEVVEANNKIRELKAEEFREIIVILTEITREIRPHIKEILESYQFLATIDLIRAKAELARQFKAIEPVVAKKPQIDWIHAIHPLLQQSLDRQGKKAVPLDIELSAEKHILIISGPNAGGKSVCLKTVGLLQYMVQCGLSIPVSERSTVGIFKHLMIDIGDEQSIENDLSTYSSHLMNMKQMMRQADQRTLLLIDEFGTGTEPQIGAAIAEAVLKQFWKRKTFAIITTHYQNLKHFADDHKGVANGAMLYDRHEMQPLFQLSIGQPGSSFAIEIARKIGISEEVIGDASEIVGSDYIQSDKYLQDIVRDKRYWESKRQTIHQREKDIERTISRYETDLTDIEKSRKAILRQAKEEAEELLREANRKIENTIREIREAQAEKEKTKLIREELEAFKESVSEIDRLNDEKIEKKMQQILARRERKEKRKKEKEKEQGKTTVAEKLFTAEKSSNTSKIAVGNAVRIKGLQSIGKVESISGKTAVVIFGDMRTKMAVERLELAESVKKSKMEQQKENLSAYSISRQTRETIDAHRKNFRQEIDVRGMRGDEALNAVMHFIDDAILTDMSQVRILHGKGDGILRQLIRQYLSTVPNVKHFADEHVQFGGAGITVAEIG
ncbi:MAG: Smr/MutS family protein [Prevotella sp.]|nr:Smr/MutS family protein [Prevotella sp.]